MANFINRRTSEAVEAWVYTKGREDGFQSTELQHTRAGEVETPVNPYVYNAAGQRVPISPSDYLVIGADGYKTVVAPDRFAREYKAS